MKVEPIGDVSSFDAEDEPKEDGGGDRISDLRGRKSPKKVPETPRVDDGLESFRAAMSDAKMELQEKRHDIEERRHKDLIADRDVERKQQAEEREKREKAVMARLQAVLNIAVGSISEQSKK